MPWSVAMSDALYGSHGFYRRHQPADHFRTSVTASPLLARALATLVTQVDRDLGEPPMLDLVDVGAGDGRLLTDLLDALPPGVRSRVRATAVDVRARPEPLAEEIRWQDAVPEQITGVLLAHEFLDNVPCEVVQRDAGAIREVLVDHDGAESLGAPIGEAARLWLERWWPLNMDGARAEVGISRDDAWAALVSTLQTGVAIAVDYGHRLEERLTGAFDGGTLTGYREGRQVMPAPDGTCDLTAHVAIDSCASAASTRRSTTVVLRQREALEQLGLSGRRPPLELATTDPPTYVAQLSEASLVGELLDRASLGSFWWLVESIDIRSPIHAGAAVAP